MTQERTKSTVFVIFFLALFLLVASLFYPFLTIILWSSLIYAVLERLFERVTRKMRPGPGSKSEHSLSKNLVAGLLSVLGVLIFVVPFGYLLISLARQVVDLLGSAVRFVEDHPDVFSFSQTSPVGGFIYRVSGGSVDLSNINIPHEVKSFIAASSNRIIGFSGTILKNIASLLVELAFMVFTLFYLFVDGKSLVGTIVFAIPIEKSYTQMFMQKMKESGRQLILGFFLVALYQGSVMFVLALVFGLKHSLVLGALTAIASFVPMVGAALVWAPLGIFIALTGDGLRAVIFLVLAAFFVSFVDNFLKPVILGERLRIHPLLIFFSILGGLKIFGLNGLILGPLIVIVFLDAVELYEQVIQSRSESRGSEGSEAEIPPK
ncbi:MAG: AI-2E family transporter [Spirochaetes bacterium]|nr:AI-2E family transporter [Spirochaetota bacterium]